MATGSASRLKPAWWTLVNGNSITSTETTINTYNGRKISEFASILICIIRGNIVRVSEQVPYSIFSNNAYSCTVIEVDSANTQRYYNVARVSDTSVKIQASSNASNAIIFIFGLGDNKTY